MRQAIAGLPVVDHHCHSLSPLGRPLDLEGALALFTESGERRQLLKHVPRSVFFRKALRDWAALLGCEPDLEEVLETRRARDPASHAARMVEEAGIEALLVDDAFPPGCIKAEELRKLLPCRVHRVLRLETLLERLLIEEEDFESFLDGFRREVEASVGGSCVALKSIIAYRSGLAWERTDEAEAAEAFGRLKREAKGGVLFRLEDKRLLDHCVRLGVEMAGRLGLPIQFHTGFGDSDLDLRKSNPLHLRPLLEDEAGRSASIVLLHAGYPFCREAGYLASLYANVHVGISLAVPLVHSGMVSVLGQLLELAPWSKVLYGSDGYTAAESYWWGAVHGKGALASALEAMVAYGSLNKDEALESAEAILRGNAVALYGLGD